MKKAISSRQVDKAGMGRVAIKLFFRICDEWNLDDEQRCILAGIVASTTLQSWHVKIEAGEPVQLSCDTLERVSYIVGIYQGVQIIFNESVQGKEWVHKPNQHFGGRSALDRMLCGRITDLADVRRYVDGWTEENYT